MCHKRTHWLHDAWRLLVVCGAACSMTVLRTCVVNGRVAVAWVQADSELGAEGGKALAPELGKLTQLQTLDLGCE